mmetsp:Transcript_17202/g.42326  ORF Transcript_17202/g.42326 Transcript_17202/m.42326 type:complete len:310 (+) Transcript_17202:290-1219(+)
MSFTLPKLSSFMASTMASQFSSTLPMDASPHTASSFSRISMPTSSSSPPALRIASCVSLSRASLLTNAMVPARAAGSLARTAMDTSLSTPILCRISLSASARLASARDAAAEHAGSCSSSRWLSTSSPPFSMASRHADGFCSRMPRRARAPAARRGRSYSCVEMRRRQASRAPARSARSCSAGSSTVICSSAHAASTTAPWLLDANTATSGPSTPADTAHSAACLGSGLSSRSVYTANAMAPTRCTSWSASDNIAASRPKISACTISASKASRSAAVISGSFSSSAAAGAAAAGTAAAAAGAAAVTSAG